MRSLRHIGIAFWLALLALTVSGVAQTQLGVNVVAAALTSSHSSSNGHHAHSGNAGHYMPDGTFMAGGMPGVETASVPRHQGADPAQEGGHTHKGHADCILCGLVATMASLTQPPPVLVALPGALPAPLLVFREREVVHVAALRPYSSRAPPRLQA